MVLCVSQRKMRSPPGGLQAAKQIRSRKNVTRLLALPDESGEKVLAFTLKDPPHTPQEKTKKIEH